MTDQVAPEPGLVTPEVMQEYLEALFGDIEGNGERYLPPGHVRKLYLGSMLPADIRGYVSSAGGAGWEMRPARTTSFRVISTARRAEDAFTTAPYGMDLESAVLFRFDNSHDIRFHAITLGGTFRVENGSDVTFDFVNFEWPDRQRGIAHAEFYADRSAAFWSVEAAHERARMIVDVALTQVNLAAARSVPLADFMLHWARSVVLVLGSYDGAGRERLARIKREVSARGFTPLLVEEFPEITGRTLEQKVRTLAGLTRFVVVDDTEPAGYLSEIEYARSQNAIIGVLYGRQHASTWMIDQHPNVTAAYRVWPYDTENPASAVDELVRWADAEATRREGTVDPAYPWRETALGASDGEATATD